MMIPKVKAIADTMIGAGLAMTGSSLLAALRSPTLGETIALISFIGAGLGLLIRIVIKLSSERATVLTTQAVMLRTLEEIKAANTQHYETDKAWKDKFYSKLDKLEERVIVLETKHTSTDIKQEDNQ